MLHNSQIPKEEGTNEPEAKTPEPQPKKHPEKGSLKGEVSKDNQIPEPTNLKIQKLVEKERSNMEIKSIFPKNEFYMEPTHLLPLSNLKLSRLHTPNPQTNPPIHIFYLSTL